MPNPARPEPPGVSRSVAELVAELRQYRLAPADELADAARHETDAAALLRTGVAKGWLTTYQANEIALGRGPALCLGNYLLLDRLGEGGMGQVFKARHRNLDRLDAVKIIRAEVIADAEVVARFRREARAAARLSHPHLVTVHDAGEADGRHYLAMELIDGSDLLRLVEQRGQLAATAVCRILYQATLGLQQAHERGLVHRDIKPGNLLLSTEGKVKVLDLGLASLRGDESMRITLLTSAYRVMGTPDFMAPEQTVNASTVDARADLYSLGCTGYFLLAGHVPFPGGDGLEKMLRQRLEPARPLPEVRPGLPPALYAIIARLMAKAPEERFQSARELAEALRPLRSSGMVPATERAAPLASASEAATIVQQPVLPPRSRRWIGIGASVALLTALLVAIAVLWPPGPTKENGKPGGTERGKEKEEKKPLAEGASLAWRAGKAHSVAEWQVFGVLFLPDGRHVAVSGGNYDKPADPGSLHLLDTRTGGRSALSGSKRSSFRWLGLTDKGETLVTVSASGTNTAVPFPRDVQLWSIASKSEKKRWPTTLTKVHAMAVAPDGRYVVLAAPEGALVTIDLATGQEGWPVVAAGPKQPFFTCLSFSPDGRLLACGGVDGSVRVLETTGWKVRYSYNAPADEQEFLAGLAFRPGDRELVGSGGVPKGRSATIQLWDLENKERKWARRHEDHHVFAQALTPDGRTLATGDQAGSVRLWDLETRQLIAEFLGQPGYGPWSLSFSPDGRTLAAGKHDGKVYLFHGEPRP